MKTVTLKNGSVEPENIVKAIQSSVNKMLEKDITGYIAMLDLMQICRNEKEINDLEQAELAILTSYGLNTVRLRQKPDRLRIITQIY